MYSYRVDSQVFITIGVVENEQSINEIPAQGEGQNNQEHFKYKLDRTGGMYFVVSIAD